MPFGGLNTPLFANFPYPSIFEVSRTRCTGLRADGQLVLAGFKESARDAFLRAQDAFVRLFLRFSGVRADVIGQPLIRAARVHAAHMFCATPVLAQKDTDLKNRPRMPSQGSERPSFGLFLGSSTQCRRRQFFPRADMHTCWTFICRIHAVKRRRGI